MKKSLLLLSLLAAFVASAETKCIWVNERPGFGDSPYNVTARFTGEFSWKEGDPEPVLRATGSSFYKVFVNGRFAFAGPARGPKGWYREDEVPLGPWLRSGRNEVSFTVVGYNEPSYYLLDQPPFLRAEVVADGKTLWSTSRAQARGSYDRRRRRRVSRYSFQRPAGEAYDLASEWPMEVPVDVVELPDVKLLPRRAPMPEFRLTEPMRTVWRGRAAFDRTGRKPSDRCVTAVRNAATGYRGYEEAELEVNLFDEMHRIGTLSSGPCDENGRLTLADGEQLCFALPYLDTGFIGIGGVTALRGGRLVAQFDEILVSNRLDVARSGCANIVIWDLPECGRTDLETFEPYAFKYLVLTAVGGEVSFDAPRLREYVHPLDTESAAAVPPGRYENVLRAARRTFAQNAVDCFTDCPGRERAGWLCDSFWTARVAYALSGTTEMEYLVLENYALPERFDGIEEGMVPMCYPADHPDGNFIPNWAFWFVLELEEFARVRHGDPALVEKLRPRVLKLMDWFAKHENSDGLLEKLPGWNFIEWSKANEFTYDVNYPANMTYAAVLEAVSRLYGGAAFAAKAARVREKVREQSWNGRFFRDHAVREDGKLVVRDDVTETCQYYAFFFGTATRETHPELWRTLREEFGPDRRAKGLHPGVWPSNAFIGNYLRLELLRLAGLRDQVRREIGGYFDKMADLTGTLWEHDNTTASCCHGFASYVMLLLE